MQVQVHVCVLMYVCGCIALYRILIGSIHNLSVREGFSDIVDDEDYEYECLESGRALDDGFLRL